MELRYFAWVRERIGLSHEVVETSANTVAELIDDLRGRSEAHAYALSDIAALRAAVDQELVDLDASIENAREVALFPPMTGG